MSNILTLDFKKKRYSLVFGSFKMLYILCPLPLAENLFLSLGLLEDDFCPVLLPEDWPLEDLDFWFSVVLPDLLLEDFEDLCSVLLEEGFEFDLCSVLLLADLLLDDFVLDLCSVLLLEEWVLSGFDLETLLPGDL